MAPAETGNRNNSHSDEPSQAHGVCGCPSPANPGEALFREPPLPPDLEARDPIFGEYVSAFFDYHEGCVPAIAYTPKANPCHHDLFPSFEEWRAKEASRT